MARARFPQTLVVSAEVAGGTQNRETGVFTPPAPGAAIYNDAADVQDEGEEIPRDSDGRSQRESFARAFLKDRTKVKDIKPRQSAAVTFEDATTRDAEIESVRLLDWSIRLRWL